MLATGKAEANTTRRERYRADQEFCSQEVARVAAWRKDRRDTQKAMLVLTGAFRMTVLDLEQASGVSRYQIRKLEKKGVIPIIQRRESDRAMLFTVPQVLWVCYALLSCRRSLHHHVGVAYDLDIMGDLLHCVWLASCPARVWANITCLQMEMHTRAIDQRYISRSSMGSAYRLAAKLNKRILEQKALLCE